MRRQSPTTCTIVVATAMTAQTRERLLYEGEELAMAAEPLNLWLAHGSNGVRFSWNSSSCWRGYVGTWAIEGGRLYLKAIRDDMTDGKLVTLETLFPGFPDGVFAHWFTGQIRCPRGELLHYVHLAYCSEYEEDLLFTFRRGVLVSQAVKRNTPSQEPAQSSAEDAP
jgi:hypothetical protein